MVARRERGWPREVEKTRRAEGESDPVGGALVAVEAVVAVASLVVVAKQAKAEAENSSAAVV